MSLHTNLTIIWRLFLQRHNSDYELLKFKTFKALLSFYELYRM